ncbi:uncharacterized protein LOC132924125 isoform X1 [Rhopalosiphum padi]|uniref:uncharacterized protein LOC132924125 isoform X1 n=1 Tax=Rhopalosiphum padi TaxID=40932 RepID=UPI00298E2CFA|nr:uncharacterized protein LOC132924125 isoform X1 [Rhopalosiphum padi]XP_060844216.1 uncharacterized protein LOC132924125 isoform X1 [Rhopalosiphum padi]XP_060844217.1 uncharacterized protein LOC132924125 isoform X1 [Rhopalosiphum padi]XP_060844218.1 uncharacterized protein LOC132924125 isoform X1 [Rhopalosiphum padi]
MSTCIPDDSNSINGIPVSQVNYFCTYCQDEISSFPCQSNTAYNSMIIFVRCAICDDFFLCLMCFSSGAEIGFHKNYHDYKLVTIFKSSTFSTKLLDALEEWISEDNEKYLGSKKLVDSWEDIASIVGSENPEDVKKEYYNTFVNGYFGQNVIKLVNKHTGYPQVVTLDQAIAMGCLENCPIYFPTRKYLKIPADREKKEDYEIIEENIKFNRYNNQDLTLQNKNILDSYQVQLLLQCVGEFGYGNWEDMCKQYNTIINMEYPRGKRIYLSAIKIKEEYVLRFIQNPILRGTWLPSSITRPQIPDRTKRIEGPRCDYEHVLKKQLPIEDLDIFFYPPSIDDVDEYKYTIEEPKIEANESTESKRKCLVCTYCQDEFEVIGYRTDNHKFSNYKLITVYTCCSNKQTCENFYLCLVCFASGAEIGKHKNSHGYTLITEVKTYSSEAYFQGSNWTAIEELAFLYALEEWLCEHSDKYIDPLNSENCITDWNSVAQHIRSKTVNEAKSEFENLILNPRIWQLFKIYAHVEPLIIYEDAVEMGCFKTSNKTSSIITDTEEETIENEKNTWNKSDLELLLDYTAIYGYGNWEKIAEEFNKTNFYEHIGKVNYFIIRTPEEIKKEYLLRYFEDPIRRGTWKPPSNKPLILDRTWSFKQPIEMKYPVVDYNLFAYTSYNNIADEFEYPYMNIAESSLDNVEDFETNIECFHSKHSMEKYNGTTKNVMDTKYTFKSKDLYMSTMLNIKKVKALISLERYNDVLWDRRIAKKCVHNYRLIEHFAMYKNKELPKIKPFSEQTFVERLVKMSRFMNIDVHRALIEGLKNEKLLRLRLIELKYYRIIGLKKLSDINQFNKLQKYRRQKKLSTLLHTEDQSDHKFQTFNEILKPSGSNENGYVQNT